MSRKRKRRGLRSDLTAYQAAYPDYDTLYRFKFDAAKKEAVRRRELLPLLAYNLFGPSVLKSIALAFDPFWKFRVGSTRVQTENRLRTRTISSVLSNRALHHQRVLKGVSQYNTSIGAPPPGHPICTAFQSTFDFSSSSVTGLAKATPLLWRSRDTTTRTRPVGSNHGEATFQRVVSFDSPPRTTRHGSHQIDRHINSLCGTTEYLDSTDMNIDTDQGDASYLSRAQIEAFFDQEKSYLLGIMPSKAVKLLPKALPDRRQYTLFRNLAELRDLPRSIRTTWNSARNLLYTFDGLPADLRVKIFDLRRNLKDVPKEWVNYSFGWRQLWSDVQDLLTSPAKITRDINRLITRRLKPTTFRTSSKVLLESVDGPLPEYEWHVGEYPWVNPLTLKSEVQRTAEFRVAVNAIFDFPTLSVPTLQREEFLRRFGVYPTITDVYNLVPWTWLIDWFTGLGDYIESIDAINSDRSTVNFGFITGVLTSKVVATRNSATTVIESWSDSPPLPAPGGSTSTQMKLAHTTVMEVQTTVRRELSNTYGVTPLLTGGSLTSYQQSILGALIAMRFGKPL